MGCAASTAKGEVRGFVFFVARASFVFVAGFFFNDDVNDDDDESLLLCLRI